MQALITDALGALFTSLIGFVSLKHKKGWMEKVLLQRQPLRDGQKDLSA